MFAKSKTDLHNCIKYVTEAALLKFTPWSTSARPSFSPRCSLWFLLSVAVWNRAAKTQTTERYSQHEQRNVSQRPHFDKIVKCKLHERQVFKERGLSGASLVPLAQKSCTLINIRSSCSLQRDKSCNTHENLPDWTDQFATQSTSFCRVAKYGKRKMLI